MKILVISPFNIFPPYWGGASRIYNLVKYLGKKNKVILLCNDFRQVEANVECDEFLEISSNPDIRIDLIKSLGRGSQIFNPLLFIKILKEIKKEKPDFILAEFAWSGLYGILMRLFTNTPYLLDEHNVEFLRFKRMKRGNKLLIHLLKLYEKLSCKFASLVFCVSEVDKNFLVNELGVDEMKIKVIPNGIDTERLYPDKKKRENTRKRLELKNDTPVILFFGKLDYKPNYEAIKIIYNEILPRVLRKIHDVLFLIVGDNPPDIKHKNILYTGIVENIEDYINASDVVICPLKSGGGTRIKILESLACGKVVISTSIGSEGLDNRKLKVCLETSDEWSEFSDCIIEKVINREKCNQFIELLEEYTWASIAKKLKTILRSYQNL